MKNFKKIFFALSLSAFMFSSCSDDDPQTAGDGDPLNEESIEVVDVTVSSTQPKVGEGDRVAVSVTIGKTFATDVTVGIKATFDNGDQTLGSISVPSGSTTGTGSIVMPSDDGVSSGTFDGSINFGSLEAFSILLKELEPNTSYVVNSNVVNFDVLDLTLSVSAGLNLLFDWANPDGNDLDMYVFDSATFTQFESSASGSRYESDLFQTQGRPDGEYFIGINVFSTTDTTIPYRFALTRPDGFVDIYEGEFVNPSGFIYPVVYFTKTTDQVTGIVTYESYLP